MLDDITRSSNVFSMSIKTFEGIVEEGRVRLASDVRLSEHAKVYVLVPDFEVVEGYRLPSPRLARPEQASDFELEVIEEPT